MNMEIYPHDTVLTEIKQVAKQHFCAFEKLIFLYTPTFECECMWGCVDSLDAIWEQ